MAISNANKQTNYRTLNTVDWGRFRKRYIKKITTKAPPHIPKKAIKAPQNFSKASKVPQISETLKFF